MSKTPEKRKVVYDFGRAPPRDAVDGSEELLPADERDEPGSADPRFRGLFAGKFPDDE